MRETLGKLFQCIPESRLKRQLRWMYIARRQKPLLSELSRVPIVKAGVANICGQATPFVTLMDDTVFYGMWPSEVEREIYSRWRDNIATEVTEDTIRVAIDVILRYLYPHTMPQLTMPYSRKERRCFHPQHVETIEDLPNLSNPQKKKVKEIFSLKPGESFLDIGAYMGYGTVRLAKELGPSSKIIAVEADPDALQLLQNNLYHNKITNVTIVPKAISSEKGATFFYKTKRQANSLISDVVGSTTKVPVETTTVDEILGEDCVDAISITINGAEVEAIEGMTDTLQRCGHLRLSMAGWYKRNGKRICDIVSPIFRKFGFNVVVGRKGGVLAWK